MLQRLLSPDGGATETAVSVPNAKMLAKQCRLVGGIAAEDSRYATQLITAAEALTIGVDDSLLPEVARKAIAATAPGAPLIIYDVRTLDDLKRLRRSAPRALAVIVAESSDEKLLCDSVSTSMFENAFGDLLRQAGTDLFDLQLKGEPTPERVAVVFTKLADLLKPA